MSSVSAEPPPFPMNCMAWSFFSDRAESYGSSACNNVKSSSLCELPGMNFFPQFVNSEVARSRPWVGALDNEDDGRESAPKNVCLGGSNCDCPDANSVEGLMFEPVNENFDGVSFVSIPKDGDGVRGITIPMSSSPRNGNGGALVGSPGLSEAINALQKYLPCNNEDEERWPGVDAYSCDEFRMYEFKVRRCMRGRSHDWTECPFAHPGEKARRRDPRRFHYSGTACPDFRKGSCRRGDACEFAHGVFECWLHPARYRTQPCKDGRNCRRRVCFFAHTPEQLRLLISQQNTNGGNSSALHASALKNSASVVDCANNLGFMEAAGSPRGYMGYLGKASQVDLYSSVMSSPTSTLVGHSHSPPHLSPPLSPSGSPPLSPDEISSCTRGPVPVKGGYLKAILSPSSLAQVRNSLRNGNQNAASANAAPRLNLRATSPVSASRRQLDRRGAMDPGSSPSSSMLAASIGCTHSASSSSSLQSSKVIAELFNSLQRLELNGSAVSPWLQTRRDGGRYSPMASDFRYCSQGSPYMTTKPMWAANNNCGAELMEEPVQRVESGRDLRAKIYGRLIRENMQEPFESPDLGWVNELVK